MGVRTKLQTSGLSIASVWRFMQVALLQGLHPTESFYCLSLFPTVIAFHLLGRYCKLTYNHSAHEDEQSYSFRNLSGLIRRCPTLRHVYRIGSYHSGLWPNG